VKITKLINLLKKTDNIVKDIEELSLGSLYFIESATKIYDSNTLIAMPVGIRQGSMLLYFISIHEYDILKYSNNSITIFPEKLYKTKPLAKIVKIGNIKLNEKIVSRIIDLLAQRIGYGGSSLNFKIRKKELLLTDSVTELYNGQILDLKLHLIKRIMDVSKWPRGAIMGWAQYHLKLGADSIEYVYSHRYFSNPDNRDIVDLLQKHRTYNAGKHRQLEEKMGTYLEKIRLRYKTMGQLASITNSTPTGENDILY